MFAAVLVLTMTAPPVNDYTIDGNVKAVKDGVVEIERANGKVIKVKIVASSRNVSGTLLYQDGKPCKLDAFKPGSVVRCVYDLESKEAIQLGSYVEIDRPKR